MNRIGSRGAVTLGMGPRLRQLLTHFADGGLTSEQNVCKHARIRGGFVLECIRAQQIVHAASST